MKSCEISFEILKSNQNPEILIEILKSLLKSGNLGQKGRFRNLVGDFAWLLTPWMFMECHKILNAHHGFLKKWLLYPVAFVSKHCIVFMLQRNGSAYISIVLYMCL